MGLHDCNPIQELTKEQLGSRCDQAQSLDFRVVGKQLKEGIFKQRTPFQAQNRELYFSFLDFDIRRTRIAEGRKWSSTRGPTTSSSLLPTGEAGIPLTDRSALDVALGAFNNELSYSTIKS